MIEKQTLDMGKYILYTEAIPRAFCTQGMTSYHFGVLAAESFPTGDAIGAQAIVSTFLLVPRALGLY